MATVLLSLVQFSFSRFRAGRAWNDEHLEKTQFERQDTFSPGLLAQFFEEEAAQFWEALIFPVLRTLLRKIRQIQPRLRTCLQTPLIFGAHFRFLGRTIGAINLKFQMRQILST